MGLAAGEHMSNCLRSGRAEIPCANRRDLHKEAVPALREALEQVGAGNVNITAGLTR
ncbi:MAG: hypothetical protein R2683_04795 [Bifidobacterium adolescentis]